jgi:hypothetical protein
MQFYDRRKLASEIQSPKPPPEDSPAVSAAAGTEPAK